MAYLVTKSLKSTGIGILLVLVLGPFGLFYASIFGGLIMCLLGVVAISLAIFASSEGILLLVWLAYPICLIICVIWSIVSINKYNNELEEGRNKFNDIPGEQNNLEPRKISDYELAYNREFYPTKKSNQNTFIIILVLLLLLTVGLYFKNQISNFFNGEQQLSKPEINLKGKYTCFDQCIYSSFEFKGSSTVIISGVYVSSYTLDENYIRIKTDKTDLLLQIKDSSTIIGEGYAKGIYKRDFLRKENSSNRSKEFETQKTTIKEDLHKKLFETITAIKSNPANLPKYYLGELDYLGHLEEYQIFEVTNTRRVESTDDYATQGDYYLYTKERDRKNNVANCEYHFTKIDGEWKLKEFRFTDADEDT